MKVLFVSSGNDKRVGIVPFIKSQGDSLTKLGVKVEYFTIQERGFKGYFRHVALLKNYIVKNPVDLVHAHYSLCGIVALLTFTEIPIVVSLMGDDVQGSFVNQNRFSFNSIPLILTTQAFLPMFSWIIVKSKNLAKFILYKKKLSVIPNGVNFDIFYPRDKNQCKKQLGLPLEKVILLFLGNPDDINKNFALAQEAHKKLNGEDILFLSPYPVRSDLISFYLNAADVLIHPSYNEGSPNLIKEAMACNTPIVATDVGDVKDVISHAENCYITSFDPDDVADKIQKILHNGKRSNGREKIAHLEIQTIAKKITKIYQSLLKNND